VYDSNFFMMRALLEQAGIPPVRMYRVRDDRDAIARALSAALAQSDLVITVGGVSVGRRDHVRSVLSRLRVRAEFWGVRQQPGKPLYFGHRGRRLVFCLPGNPASAFTCFYLYVWPALRALSGVQDVSPSAASSVLEHGGLADPSRWRILKARVRRGRPSRVDVLAGQGSHIVTPLARTTHLALLPPGRRRRRRVRRNRRVISIRLPHAEDDRR
jgi:molybdopterin molybdotransferase